MLRDMPCTMLTNVVANTHSGCQLCDDIGSYAGRACIQRAASCQSYRGQHARVKEAGPNISGGTMLPTLTWATLSSNHTATDKSGGPVINVQMAICTAGQHLSTAEPQAMGVLSAVATRSASTTRWLPRLLWLQLSGTMLQMMAPLTM